jgi:DUF218 domain
VPEGYGSVVRTRPVSAFSFQLFSEGPRRFSKVLEGPRRLQDTRPLPNQVEILGACKNTRDEAIHTEVMAREKGWKKILLVTSAWHMRRALPTFRNTGLEVIPVGCDAPGTAALQNHDRVTLIPRTGTLETFELWFTETLGYAWYRLRGWTSEKR